MLDFLGETLLARHTVELFVVLSMGQLVPTHMMFDGVEGEGGVQLFHISPGESRCQGLLCNFVIKPFLARVTISLTVLSFKALAVLFSDFQNAGLAVLKTDYLFSSVKTLLCST